MQKQKVARTVELPTEALGNVMTDWAARRSAEMSDRYLGRISCDSRAVRDGDTGREGQLVEGRKQLAEKQRAARSPQRTVGSQAAVANNSAHDVERNGDFLVREGPDV